MENSILGTNKKEKNEEIKYVSVMKAIGLISVIISHATHFYTEGWGFSIGYNSLFSNIMSYVSTYHIAVFVFCSGILFYNSNYNISFKKFFINKTKRLLFPYFICLFLFLIPIRIFVNWYSNDTSISLETVKIILGLDVGHLWYILMNFNLLIIFFIFRKFIGRNKISTNVILFLILNYSTIIIDILPFRNVLQLSKTIYFMMFFYLGYIFIKEKEKINKFINKDKWLIFLLIHFILFTINIKVTYYNIIIIKIIKLICTIFGILSVYTISLKLLDSKIVYSRVYLNLNKFNFQYYLLHEPLMYIVLFYIMKTNLIKYDTLIVIICLIVGIIGTGFIIFLIEKFKKIYYRRKDEGVNKYNNTNL